jgi:hypothetical protein
MRKIFFWLINLLLVVGTGGLWLLILIPYLIWRNSKKSVKQVAPEVSIIPNAAEPSNLDKIIYSGVEWVKRNKIAAAASAIAAVLALVSLSYGGDFLQQRKTNALFEEVEVLIAQDNFLAVESKVQEILMEDPTATSKVENVKNRLTNLKAAIELTAKAKDYESKGQFLDASLAIKQIRSSERDYPSFVDSELSRLEANTVAEIEARLMGYQGSRSFEKGIELINLFTRVYPVNKTFVSVKEKISNDLEKQKDTERRLALAKLSKRFDSFQDVTWYSSPSSPRYRNANGFYLYFGVSGTSKLPLRLVMQYYSSDWLFIESAKVNVDGSVYSLSATDWERDNDSNIWEWSDEVLDDRALIEQIIKSKSAVIRFEGSQYYDTRTISSSQKAALKQVLEAYDAF